MESRLPTFIRRIPGFFEFILNRHGGLSVAVFAFVYYGIYFNADLTLNGEAGSNVLIAQRILEGWRPIKDMFIGYNLMWFYPLTWIFEFTGPHLLATRIYFMVLSGASGILGFFLVRRATGNSSLAAIASGLMILMPGAMYRNNVGFVGVLASFALVYGYVIAHRSRLTNILWMGFCGAAMSLCFLIRIEPSLIASIVWAGLAILYPLGVRGEFFSRLRVVVLGTLLGLAAFAAVHAPFVIQAHQRGFGQEFTAQYSQFVRLLYWELQREIQKVCPVPISPVSPTSKTADKVRSVATGSNATEIEKSKPPASSDGRRPRATLSDCIQGGRLSFFALSMYFPILSAGVLTLIGSMLFLGGAFSGHSQNRRAGLAILATTGCALALFPQYFFFRPDSVHLAEFMVPFYPALACGAAGALGLLQGKRWMTWSAVPILLIICFQIIISFNALFGREGSGSIRIARGKTAIFNAPGGIHFLIKPENLADWEGLRDVLARSSRKGDFLVTYPYVPLLNVMSERPSYQFKLYVDNATEAPNFSEKTIRDLQEKKPALVVINNRAINQTEFSRFQNWASPVYDHLKREYVSCGTYLENIEVFVRPDRATPPTP